MYYTYILRSLKDGGYYIGSSENLEKRLGDHNRGSVKASRNRRPLEIVYTEEYATRSEAVARERQIKSYKGGVAFKRLLGLE